MDNGDVAILVHLKCKMNEKKLAQLSKKSSVCTAIGNGEAGPSSIQQSLCWIKKHDFWKAVLRE